MDYRQRIDKWFWNVLWITTAIFLSYMVCKGKEYSQPVRPISKIKFIGTYEIEGKIEPISDHEAVNIENTNRVILKGHFDKNIPKGDELFLNMYHMRMSIKQNGEKIYEYGQIGSHPAIVHSIGSDWAKVLSNGISTSDEIEIVLESVYHSSYEGAYNIAINNIYAGDRYAFIWQQIKKDIFQIAICCIIFIIGCIFLVVIEVLKFMKEPVFDAYLPCILLIMMGAICTFINYDYVTLLFNNSFAVNMFDLVSQLLIYETLLVYLKSYLKSKVFIGVVRHFIYITICAIVIYFGIQICGITDNMEFIAFVAPIGASMLCIALVFLIIDWKKYAEQRIKSVLLSSIVLGICAIAEMLHYSFTNTYWNIVFQLGLLFFTVMQINALLAYTKEQIEKSKRTESLEKELSQSRIAIMMSQIQPHFLYNALTSIQELCLCNPLKAHAALMKFSQFLRGNMDSLTTTSLIPFERTLQHVKNYLALEKIRYGEYLQIEYEIEVSDFFLPTLTIQPIVENAVRYGVGKKEEGGIVRLKTSENEDCVEVIVEDNGIGFDTELVKQETKQEKRSHIGLANVKKRLEIQCGGTMKVESRINVGTRVTVYIPKRRPNNEDCSYR